MSNDRNHSEQFERYLKGQMSPEEAHAFEREVLDDPFAQEALEGYESQGANAVHDLEKLRSRIQVQQKNTWPWMRIAAVVALLVVGSLTVYFFTGQIEGEQLAMEEESIEDPTQSGPNPDTISIRSNEKLVSEGTQIDTFEKDGLKVEDEDEEIVENYLAENEVAAEEGSGINAKTELALSQSESIETTPQLEGKREDLQLAEADALEEMVIEPSADEMIVLEEAVPAQAFVDKKKMAVKENEVRGAVARSAPRSGGEINNEAYTPPRPLISDSLYQQYLRDELIYPEAAKQSNINGEVILQLTIDTSSEIIDIRIEKSLGYGCDEEAIRLVEEGPKWNAAIANGVQVSDTVRVSIQFKPPR